MESPAASEKMSLTGLENSLIMIVDIWIALAFPVLSASVAKSGILRQHPTNDMIPRKHYATPRGGQPCGGRKQSAQVILPLPAGATSREGELHIRCVCPAGRQLALQDTRLSSAVWRKARYTKEQRAEKALRKAGGRIGGRSYGQFAAGKRAAD